MAKKKLKLWRLTVFQGDVQHVLYLTEQQQDLAMELLTRWLAGKGNHFFSWPGTTNDAEMRECILYIHTNEISAIQLERHC